MVFRMKEVSRVVCIPVDLFHIRKKKTHKHTHTIEIHMIAVGKIR